MSNYDYVKVDVNFDCLAKLISEKLTVWNKWKIFIVYCR